MDKKSLDIVENYISGFSEKTAQTLREAVEYILEAAPEAQPKLNYGVLAFALIPGGKREEQVMIGGYQKHVGFYPHPTAISYFEDELKGKYKYAKGSVQFPLSEPLPKDLIIEMVKYRKGLLEK